MDRNRVRRGEGLMFRGVPGWEGGMVLVQKESFGD